MTKTLTGMPECGRSKIVADPKDETRTKFKDEPKMDLMSKERVASIRLLTGFKRSQKLA